MDSIPALSADVQALQARLLAADARADELAMWLDVLCETSPIATYVVSSRENRVVRANPAVAELYGISLPEILNCDPFTLALRVTHPDDLIAEQRLFAELAVGARNQYQIEKRFVRADGSIRWGAMTFCGIFENPAASGDARGPLRFVIGHVIDISERKSLEDTLQRREEELRHAQKVDGIGRLAAGIAHDFNNLLTVICGHGEVLKASLRDGRISEPEASENLGAILAASERAADLTAQLLAHGRRESVMPRVFVLSNIVGTFQRLLRRTIGADIEVVQILSAEGAIFADQGHVAQVVMNLMLNARDAMPRGGRLELTTRDLVVAANAGAGAVPGPGEWVVLSVADTGHGMTAEVQAHMFEAFFTTRSDRPGTQGTGLGLATVERIVTQANGSIVVRSAPGAGTTVSVFFPRVALPADEPAVQSPASSMRAPLNSQRVLVVEDDPSVRALVATLLLGAHYRVMVARDGEEALRFIDAEAEPFHLIVTDLAMPTLGGASLAQRLHEQGRRPRLLFISGYSDHPLTDLLRYGHLLPKPFSPAQLLTAVASALSSADSGVD